MVETGWMKGIKEGTTEGIKEGRKGPRKESRKEGRNQGRNQQRNQGRNQVGTQERNQGRIDYIQKERGRLTTFSLSQHMTRVHTHTHHTTIMTTAACGWGGRGTWDPRSDENPIKKERRVRSNQERRWVRSNQERRGKRAARWVAEGQEGQEGVLPKITSAPPMHLRHIFCNNPRSGRPYIVGICK